MPFGTLLLFTVLIFPDFACGQTKRRDHAARGQIPDIRISAQITDQDDFVNTTICHTLYLLRPRPDQDLNENPTARLRALVREANHPDRGLGTPGTG